ncbi:DeoR/GlpR family DNA-binding transcription regulator [Azospirillum sp. SYSU D00513]|uniref:DeoR/GlpR family DNA-binding transcription regulator n=1 Tax=Azospirillum sp. SYSU D00513 TaxID=2812561 RepID=UPI001A97552F|nr:DeoR/GlpR family DNA-binding transcription regulator [Azospirillum sp. SYSU D00513]
MNAGPDAAGALPQERQRAILERLNRDGRVFAANLAQEFQTSEDTIRRDLRELATAGLCQRVYGGALPISPVSIPITVRRSEFGARKRALGAVLASLIRPGQFVFLDAGTTNLAAAQALPEGLGITVATHDPAIAACLVGRGGVELILLGGKVDPLSGAASGANALRTAMEMRPDLLLLGTCALDPAYGVAVFGYDDAEMKRLLVRGAGSVVTAVINDKLGTGAPHLVAPADALSDIVVEADAAEAPLEALRALGMRVHRAAATQED